MYGPEVDLGFGASVITPYTLAGHASTFEVGGRFRNEHKFLNQNTQNFTPNASGEDASLTMTNFLNDFQDPNYYGGAYQFGPAVDYNKVRAFGAQSVTSGIFGNAFDQVEKVSAGYLMNSTTIGRFRLVAGVHTVREYEREQPRLPRGQHWATNPRHHTDSRDDLLS